MMDRVPIQDWNEYDAKKMLRTYGVPTCHEILAGSVDAARQAAHTIGFPVAVKGCHATLAHKTERGLVHLDLASDAAVTAACESIKKEAGEAAFLVCEMVPGKREFIAGVHRHPGFPPSVLFGLGGIFAEALQDTAIRLAPLTLSEALDQIAAIRSQALLDAHRGRPAVDRKALAQILVNIGQLALDCPQIEAIDLNPILIRDGQPVVVDALFEQKK
jgi:acetyltransferase